MLSVLVATATIHRLLEWRRHDADARVRAMGLARAAGRLMAPVSEGSVMRTLAGIMLASAVGGAARYSLDGFVSDRVGGMLPWGTFVINVSGSLLLGFLFTVLTERVTVDPTVRFSITTGLIGSYTTFSTLSLETVQLVQDRSYLLAVANSVGSMVCGLVATGLGIIAGRAV
jgi:fluoride exporter